MMSINHYALRPKRSTMHAKAPPRRATKRALQDYHLVLRSHEGGRGCPSADGYRARAKILLLVRLKQLYPQDIFLRSAPLTIAFFDDWFELEELGNEVSFSDILENITPDLFDHPDNGPEATELREIWSRQKLQQEISSDLKYRIRVGDQVVGWLQATSWQGGQIRGYWESTITPAGKSFTKDRAGGEEYDAIVEVWNTAFRGKLVILDKGETTLCTMDLHSTIL